MAKRKSKKDQAREDRFDMEIFVDTYNSEERAAGWYCYLEEKLNCPFTAKCITKRAVSPLKVNDVVEVTGMAPEGECRGDIFVMIRWGDDGLAVPLAQLKPIKADKMTVQAIEDWHYWIEQGYGF
jgi:hypothetical protein